MTLWKLLWQRCLANITAIKPKTTPQIRTTGVPATANGNHQPVVASDLHLQIAAAPTIPVHGFVMHLQLLAEPIRVIFLVADVRYVTVTQVRLPRVRLGQARDRRWLDVIDVHLCCV